MKRVAATDSQVEHFLRTETKRRFMPTDDERALLRLLDAERTKSAEAERRGAVKAVRVLLRRWVTGQAQEPSEQLVSAWVDVIEGKGDR